MLLYVYNNITGGKRMERLDKNTSLNRFLERLDKNKFSITITDATKEKLKRICLDKGIDKTAAISLSIDRLYKDVYEPPQQPLFVYREYVGGEPE